jgi:hypothetical protein
MTSGRNVEVSGSGEWAMVFIASSREKCRLIADIPPLLAQYGNWVR